MTKKIIFAIAFLVICIVFAVFLSENRNEWACENGEWVKYGNPSIEKPEEKCSEKL